MLSQSVLTVKRQIFAGTGLAMALGSFLVHYLQINRRRLDAGVAHLIANIYQVRSIPQAEHGKGVTHLVHTEVWHIGFLQPIAQPLEKPIVNQARACYTGCQ
jgi:hypothetical protein